MASQPRRLHQIRRTVFVALAFFGLWAAGASLLAGHYLRAADSLAVALVLALYTQVILWRLAQRD